MDNSNFLLSAVLPYQTDIARSTGSSTWAGVGGVQLLALWTQQLLSHLGRRVNVGQVQVQVDDVTWPSYQLSTNTSHVTVCLSVAAIYRPSRRPGLTAELGDSLMMTLAYRPSYCWRCLTVKQ